MSFDIFSGFDVFNSLKDVSCLDFGISFSYSLLNLSLKIGKVIFEFELLNDFFKIEFEEFEVLDVLALPSS